MHSKHIAKVAAGLTACALALSLTACGGGASDGDTGNTQNAGATQGTGDFRNSKEPVSVSQAFGSKGLWFSSDAPGKDEQINRILLFDGNGNVTCYMTGDLTYSDIKDMSDEEIISHLGEWDKAGFDKWKESNFFRIDKLIEGHEARANGAQERIDFNKKAADNLREDRKQIEALQYQEPTAVPFKLSIETDNSGNVTAEETLSFSVKSPAYFDCDSPYDKRVLWADEDERYTFTSRGTDSPMVYDKYYNGYYEAELWTQVGEEFTVFDLDTPDTEGIEVD